MGAQPVPILNKQKNRGVREYRGNLGTRTGLSPPQRKTSATANDEVNTPPTSNKSRIRDLWLNQEEYSEIIEEPSPTSAMEPPERTSSLTLEEVVAAGLSEGLKDSDSNSDSSNTSLSQVTRRFSDSSSIISAVRKSIPSRSSSFETVESDKSSLVSIFSNAAQQQQTQFKFHDSFGTFHDSFGSFQDSFGTFSDSFGQFSDSFGTYDDSSSTGSSPFAKSA